MQMQLIPKMFTSQDLDLTAMHTKGDIFTICCKLVVMMQLYLKGITLKTSEIIKFIL